MTVKRSALSPMQKLQALAFRFYQNDPRENPWQPKAGDYYTTSRADLELYRVIKVERDVVFTSRCDGSHEVTPWKLEEFISMETFGARRVHVPDWIFGGKGVEA